MRTLRLKNGYIDLSDEDEKYLDAIKEFTGVKSFEDMTGEQFNTAFNIEKLSRGETLNLPSGVRVRMGKK